MQQSPAWEANQFSAGQEIPCILWNLKVHNHIYKYLPPVPVLSTISIQGINVFQAFCFLLCNVLINWSLTISVLIMVYPKESLISWTLSFIQCFEYRDWIFCINMCFHDQIKCGSPRTEFSKLVVCVCLLGRNHVLQPYKTTDKINVFMYHW
jgi:hypothetical protein